MAIQTKPNRFLTLLLVMTVMLVSALYSCNNSTDATKKDDAVTTPKDTTPPATVDTSKKMSTDTSKTDTTGRGVPPPPAHSADKPKQ
jgi:uncharacterized protein YpuA (DUF1002 family)